MTAREVLLTGTIVEDIRNDSDNSRLQVVEVNNTTYLIIKKGGEIVEFVEGVIKRTQDTGKAVLKSINRLFTAKYTYETGGGVLKSGADKAQYHYLEFKLFI